MSQLPHPVLTFVFSAACRVLRGFGSSSWVVRTSSCTTWFISDLSLPFLPLVPFPEVIQDRCGVCPFPGRFSVHRSLSVFVIAVDHLWKVVVAAGAMWAI